MASTCEKVALFLLAIIGGYFGGRYLFGKSGDKPSTPAPVDLGFAKTVADALAAARGLKTGDAGEQGRVDRQRYFFLFRRARDLGLADATLRSGAGLQTLQKRVDGQAAQVEKQLAAWLGDASKRGPYFGADTTFAGRARHLDLGTKVSPRLGDTPITSEAEAINAQTPNEAQARTLRELDQRRSRVTSIVWRAAAIDPDVWKGSGDAVQLQIVALAQLLDRRLRAVERLRYEVSAGATSAGIGSSFVDRVFAAGSRLTPTQGPWTDGFVARAFEAPAIARSAASDDTSWAVEPMFDKVLSVTHTLSIDGPATSGTFTLEYGGEATSAIPFDATRDQVQAAIAALGTLGGIQVTCQNGRLPEGPVKIILDGEPIPGDELRIGPANALVGPAHPKPVLSPAEIERSAESEPKPRFNVQGGSNPWYLDRPTAEFDWNVWPGTRVVGKSWALAPDPIGARSYGWMLTPPHDSQTISLIGLPTGGTFKLAFDGKPTGELPVNATANDVKSALAGLAGGGPRVIVLGGPLGFNAVTVSYPEVGLQAPKLEVAFNGLTGGISPKPEVTPRAQPADILTPGAAIGELFALIVTPADGSPSFDRRDWWNRSWLHSDGIMAALQIEALQLGLLRAAVTASPLPPNPTDPNNPPRPSPDAEFDDLPWRYTVALEDYFGVRNLPVADNGIMKRGRSDYFENGAIALEDLQVGDQVVFQTPPALVALGANVADYPTVLITDVDTSLKGTDINAAGLGVQGFNSARLDHAALQTLFVKKADAALNAVQDYIGTEIARLRAQAAATGTPFTPPSRLPWDIGILSANDDAVNTAAVLRLWNPYGDTWDDPGPWWLWINLFAPVWHHAFGTDGAQALLRMPGAVRWDSDNTIALSNHANPWRKANAPSTLNTRAGFQAPPWEDPTQPSADPGDMIFVPLFQPTGGWEVYFETKVTTPADSAWPPRLDPVRADSRWTSGLAPGAPDANDVRVIRPRVKQTV